MFKGFQYSPSHEGAHKYACFRNISLLISILPLSRGGSNFRLLSALCSNFNTPPLTRGLGVVIDGSLCIDISILPLSRGGSAISKACLVLSVFQYSPSHEGAHALSFSVPFTIKFQYSPSHEGARSRSSRFYNPSNFNTPPLTRGLRMEVEQTLPQNFNTPPLTRGLFPPFCPFRVLPHFNTPPLTRGLLTRSSTHSYSERFQYSPSHEGALQNLTTI